MPSYSSPIHNKNPEPNNRQLLTLFFLFGSFLVGLIIISFIILNQLIYLIPVSIEEKIGSLIASQFDNKKELSQTSIKLNQLLDNIEISLPDENNIKRDYKVIYIPENTVNALAIPGNKIIIYEGLLKELNSENELVMILGHEVGHFAHRDHLRSLGNVLLFKLIISYFLGNIDILNSGVDLANVIVNSQYSQSQETKADEFGLDVLNAYYGHVGGAIALFEIFKNQEKNSLPISFLSSHPLPQKRINHLQKVIKQKGYKENTLTELNLSIN